MQYRLHISTFEFGWHCAYIGYYAKIFLMVQKFNGPWAYPIFTVNICRLVNIVYSTVHDKNDC